MVRVLGLVLTLLFTLTVSLSPAAQSKRSAPVKGDTSEDKLGSREADSAAAEVLFQRGRDAMETEDWDQACAAFEESLRFEQAVGAVMNLAVCEEKRGHLARAWERWVQALRLLDTSDSRRAYAEKRRAELDRQVPRLAIGLSEAAPNALEIERDGIVIERASFDVPMPVDPGSHRIVVRAPGHKPRVYEEVIEAGEERKLLVEPGPRDAGAKVKRGSVQRGAGIASTSVGALGVVGGIVTGVMVQRQKKVTSAHCDENMECDDVGLTAARRGKNLLIGNAVSWGVGVTGLAAGTVLLVTLPGKDGTTSAALDLSGSRLGVKVSGTF